MDALAALRSKLDAFDWDYEFSDDHQVWLRGCQVQRELFAEAMLLGTEAMDLYFEYVRRKAP